MGNTRLEPLVLSEDERRRLENWAKRRSTAQGLALRARIVLACAQGGSNIAVAARLGVNRSTVSKWRARFLRKRLDGLCDEPRPGVPRTITDAQVEEVVVRTLEEVPEGATHWSKRELAKRAGISATSVHRIWRAFGLQPWRTEDFKISPDPLLIDKIRDVIGLYLAPPDGAVVFAVDEKPQIQALERTAPVLPMLPGVPERRSFDYVRHGTIDLFAALNTATGMVIGKLSAQHRAVDFRDFLDEIDQQTDPALAVHVICDNLSAHKAPAVQRWLAAHPRFVLHFTPTYSSWISQVERWFAELQRRCLDRGVFCSLDQLTTALEDWIKIWNDRARRSSGPRPPTRSSTASAATAHASPDRDISGRGEAPLPAAPRAGWGL
jgi:transposase